MIYRAEGNCDSLSLPLLAALNALDASGRTWRMALSTPSLSGIRAVVRAGLWVAVRTGRWVGPDLQVLRGDLPELPDAELAMVSAGDMDDAIGQRLCSVLRQVLKGKTT